MTFYGIFSLDTVMQTRPRATNTGSEFLGAPINANQDTLNKAYRKKSRLLHPDKVKRAFVANASKDKSKSETPKKGVHVNQGPSQREINKAVKEAHERSARLNVVANILRGPSRERYDHFLKNGFPKWKGTGYYYSRFRPGLGSVLAGLFLVFGGAAHYAALVLSWKRQREFVNRYIRQARRAAWGDELGVRGIPGVDSTAPVPSGEGDGEANAVPVNRRQKRMMDRENRKESKRPRARNNVSNANNDNGDSTPTTESTGERKRVIAENGKVLIVDAVGNVFLEEETEGGERQEFLLDIEEIQRPSIRDTMFFRLPGWCFQNTVGRLPVKSDSSADDVEITVPIEEEEEATAAEQIVEEAASFTAPSKNGGSSRRRGKRSQKS